MPGNISYLRLGVLEYCHLGGWYCHASAQSPTWKLGSLVFLSLPAPWHPVIPGSSYSVILPPLFYPAQFRSLRYCLRMFPRFSTVLSFYSCPYPLPSLFFFHSHIPHVKIHLCCVIWCLPLSVLILQISEMSLCLWNIPVFSVASTF